MTNETQPNADFWKFRAIDERLAQLLTERELWFSVPGHFNDPFDCQVDIENTFSAIRSELREHLDDGFSGMIHQVEEHVRSTRYAYLCMCQAWNQTLMWSHYGENHRGVALGFTFEPDSLFGVSELTSGDVVYRTTALKEQMGYVNEALGRSQAFPPHAPGLMWSEGIEFRQQFHEALTRLYEIVRFMKAECWSYEEEYRFEVELRDTPASGIARKFSPRDLKHILFGTLCDKTYVEEVRRLLSGLEWEHVEYWKCERDSVNLILKAEKFAN